MTLRQSFCDCVGHLAHVRTSGLHAIMQACSDSTPIYSQISTQATRHSNIHAHTEHSAKFMFAIIITNAIRRSPVSTASPLFTSFVSVKVLVLETRTVDEHTVSSACTITRQSSIAAGEIVLEADALTRRGALNRRGAPCDKILNAQPCEHIERTTVQTFQADVLINTSRHSQPLRSLDFPLW
jgi:hypothetical protein